MIKIRSEIINPAYLAGLLDSDGSLSVTKLHKNRTTPNYRAIFQIQWKKTKEAETILKQLKKQYNGTICYPKIQETSLSKNPTIKYCCTGFNLDKLLSDIEPFVLLKYEQLKLVQKLRRTSYRRKNKSQVLKNMHQYIFDRMQFINKNGGCRRFAEGIYYV